MRFFRNGPLIGAQEPSGASMEAKFMGETMEGTGLRHGFEQQPRESAKAFAALSVYLNLRDRLKIQSGWIGVGS